MGEREYFVYILASRRNGTLYIGVTNDLKKRIWQHKNKLVDGFTKTYDVAMLVYYERFRTPVAAIEREKRLKKWNRAWKLRLIESMNPGWKDLYYTKQDTGSPPSREWQCKHLRTNGSRDSLAGMSNGLCLGPPGHGSTRKRPDNAPMRGTGPIGRRIEWKKG